MKATKTVKELIALKLKCNDNATIALTDAEFKLVNRGIALAQAKGLLTKEELDRAMAMGFNATYTYKKV